MTRIWRIAAWAVIIALAGWTYCQKCVDAWRVDDEITATDETTEEADE